MLKIIDIKVKIIVERKILYALLNHIFINEKKFFAMQRCKLHSRLKRICSNLFQHDKLQFLSVVG